MPSEKTAFFSLSILSCTCFFYSRSTIFGVIVCVVTTFEYQLELCTHIRYVFKKKTKLMLKIVFLVLMCPGTLSLSTLQMQMDQILAVPFPLVLFLCCGILFLFFLSRVLFLNILNILSLKYLLNLLAEQHARFKKVIKRQIT